MRPGQYNHTFVAGDDYEVTVVLKQGGQIVDTSGYSWQAQIRQGYLPHGELVAEFGVELITGGAKLSLTAEQTAELAGVRLLVWDLQADSGEIKTWLSGSVQVIPEVTNGY